MTVRVMEGHVLDVLKSLPANTFQCAATSPPYYGLRDYGLAPQVWGGEPEHEHEWGPVLPFGGSVAGNRTPSGFQQRDSAAHAGSRVQISGPIGGSGQFCACGAWLGSLGLEPTPELYVEHLVSVFREVRRTLRPDGVCWVNLGDSYAGSGKGPSNSIQPLASQLGAEREMSDEEHDRLLREAMDADMERADQKRRNPAQFANGQAPTAWLPVPRGCKSKDLLGMPWMVAFALRADGWYLRSEIIWSKANPMPESVTDRPTKAHETVFLLAKSRTYFYDAQAIREEGAEPDRVRLDRIGGANGHSVRHSPGALVGPSPTRNKRSVWEIATAPFPEAHFATFPPKLVEPMLLAGTSEKGCCPECGAPWVRSEAVGNIELDVRRPQARRALELYDSSGLTYAHIEAIRASGITDTGKATVTQNGTGKNAEGVRRLATEAKAALGGYYREFLLAKPTATGWRPTCAHDAPPVPCQVLDPFGGAGTTGLVADRLGRDCTLIELNPEYAQMARERIEQDAPLFVDVA